MDLYNHGVHVRSGGSALRATIRVLKLKLIRIFFINQQ